MNAAVYVGAAVVALGALTAFMIPRQRRAEAEVTELMPAYEEAA